MAPQVAVTTYVDDIALEAIATETVVVLALPAVVLHLAAAVQSTGMEWSLTKNCCSASKPRIARALAHELRVLRVKVALRVMALGVGLGAGTRRNAGTARARLEPFRARKKCFRRLRYAWGQYGEAPAHWWDCRSVVWTGRGWRAQQRLLGPAEGCGGVSRQNDWRWLPGYDFRAGRL